MVKLHNLINKFFNQARHSVLDMLWLYVIHGTTYALFLFGFIYASVIVSHAMQITPLVGLIGSVVLLGLLMCVSPTKKIIKSIINFAVIIVESLIAGGVFVWILYGLYVAILLPIDMFTGLLTQSGIL